jgi:hypothetical protein
MIWLQILFSTLIFAGIFMTVAPMMPGLPFMFLLAVLFGFLENFSVLTLNELGILSIILAVSLVIDYSAGILGAKFGGASWRSIFVGLSAGVLGGLLTLSPFGAFIGLFAGIVMSEMFRNHNGLLATRAAVSYIIGATFGIMLNVCLATLFFSLFIYFVFF